MLNAARPTTPTSKPALLGRDVFGFTRRDANRDGALNSAEYGAGRQAQSEFGRYDRNHDGRLDRLELMRGKAADRVQTVGRAIRESDVVAINQAYAELLGRAPDRAGLEHFMGRMREGATIEQVRAEIQASPEYQARTIEASPKTAAPVQDPNSFFMKQVYDPKWNPDGPMTSANCGPTSLAMALKGLGLQPPGLSDPESPEAWIDATRMAMTGNTDDHAYTNSNQVIEAARASGATAEQIGFAGIDQALAEGKLVAASGNPAAYNGDWQERGLANSEYDGGHFILVTGKDADGNYMINDPLSNVGSVAVTPAQLEAYMAYQGWDTAIAIGKPDGVPSAPEASPPIQPIEQAPMTSSPAATGDTAQLLGAMTAEAIEGVLVARGSVLAGQGYGAYILQMEQQYGVPAAQFLAQAVMESSLGNDGYTQPGFNIGNIRPGTSWDGPIVDGGSGQFRVYSSWEEGIEDYFKLLAGPIYAGKSLEEQLYTYCPPWDGNDTAHYHDQIQKLIYQWTGIQM